MVLLRALSCFPPFSFFSSMTFLLLQLVPFIPMLMIQLFISLHLFPPIPLLLLVLFLIRYSYQTGCCKDAQSHLFSLANIEHKRVIFSEFSLLVWRYAPRKPTGKKKSWPMKIGEVGNLYYIQSFVWIGSHIKLMNTCC